MEKIDLRSFTYDELAEYVAGLGQPKFRAGQLFSWLHEKKAVSFSEMTNLPKALLSRLEEETVLTRLEIRRKLVSQIDGTVKYLFALPDGELVESVVMRYEHGLSICLSTQVGCRMGCSFCASTKAGFVRNLAPSEILGQIYAARVDLGERISNVVLMGIGEPLDNFENVVAFMNILSDERGENLSLRHLSLSTCGLVDRIRDLQKLRLGLTLSVSLHAPNDAVRERTMPIAKRYSMDTLLAACREYAAATGRRVSFEYALIAGVNDSPQNAAELATRLKGMLCHVNLIPVNEIREASYRKSRRETVRAFQTALTERGINATVRRTLGADISAACGQLRREADEKQQSSAGAQSIKGDLS